MSRTSIQTRQDLDLLWPEVDSRSSAITTGKYGTTPLHFLLHLLHLWEQTRFSALPTKHNCLLSNEIRGRASFWKSLSCFNNFLCTLSKHKTLRRSCIMGDLIHVFTRLLVLNDLSIVAVMHDYARQMISACLVRRIKDFLLSNFQVSIDYTTTQSRFVAQVDYNRYEFILLWFFVLCS